KTGLGYDGQLNERDLNNIHINKSEVFESTYDSSVNESEEDNNQVNDRYKAGEGYHAVPPSYTGNFMPPRPYLSFDGLDDSIFKFAISETVTSMHETETSGSKTSKESIEKPKTVRSSALLIEEWESNSDEDCEIRPLIEQNKPSYTKINFDDSIFKFAISETVTSMHETETSRSKTSKESMEKPKTVRSSAPLIEEWESNSDEDCEIKPLIEQNKPSYTKINFGKSDENTRKSV
nr:hypothetical protein [Tanacetum cinerariifolium]